MSGNLRKWDDHAIGIPGGEITTLYCSPLTADPFGLHGQWQVSQARPILLTRWRTRSVSRILVDRTLEGPVLLGPVGTVVFARGLFLRAIAAEQTLQGFGAGAPGRTRAKDLR